MKNLPFSYFSLSILLPFRRSDPSPSILSPFPLPRFCHSLFSIFFAFLQKQGNLLPPRASCRCDPVRCDCWWVLPLKQRAALSVARQRAMSECHGDVTDMLSTFLQGKNPQLSYYCNVVINHTPLSGALYSFSTRLCVKLRLRDERTNGRTDGRTDAWSRLCCILAIKCDIWWQ